MPTPVITSKVLSACKPSGVFIITSRNQVYQRGIEKERDELT